MLKYLVDQKQYQSNPLVNNATPCLTLDQIRRIPSEVFETPYTHMFRGTISEYPRIFNRRAGWTPQYEYYPLTWSLAHRPNHCFQKPCNYVGTVHKCDGQCIEDECINLYR